MADPKIVAPYLRAWLDAKLKRPSDLENHEILTRQSLSRIIRSAERENVEGDFDGVYLGTIHKIAAYLNIPTEALRHHPDDPKALALLAQTPTIEGWLQRDDAMVTDGIPATPEFKRAVQNLVDLYSKSHVS